MLLTTYLCFNRPEKFTENSDQHWDYGGTPMNRWHLMKHMCEVRSWRIPFLTVFANFSQKLEDRPAAISRRKACGNVPNGRERNPNSNGYRARIPYKGYCSELGRLVMANLAQATGCQETGPDWDIGLWVKQVEKSISLMAGKPTAVLQTEL